jgi:predicted NBD/HSP70 family sugar kinase
LTEDPRRSASRERVLRVLRETGPVSRADIARRTALSRATVSSVLAEFRDAGLVIECDSAPEDPRAGQAGRPPSLVRLDRSAGAALGIDFGKRHLRVVVADLGHSVLAERCVELDSDHEAVQGMEVAAGLVDEVLSEAEIERGVVVGVGMGLPGPIHLETGELGSATILPGWVGVRASKAMSDRLGLDVRVDNDANLGALAECVWGAAKGCANVAYLKAATGIGAGLIIAGRLFRGTGGTAGEIGHTSVDPRGPVCRCGNRGCLETLVGVPALLALLAPAGGPAALPEVLAQAQNGDLACRRAIAEAGTAIGAAAAMLCNLINPERIVVSGDLGAAGELLLGPMRDALRRTAIPSAADDVEVVAGVLGERAEVLGAVALVLRDSGLSPAEAEVRAEAVA